MNSLFDDMLVGAMLAAAVGYVALTLGPGAWRRRLFAGFAQVTGRAPAVCRLQGITARLHAAAVQPTGACGGCGSCRTDDQSTAAEVRIPIGKIGRR